LPKNYKAKLLEEKKAAQKIFVQKAAPKMLVKMTFGGNPTKEN